MPKYFCEYCGIYLTHSSPGGRKQHSHGRKHINNKIEYYSQFLYEFQQNAYKNLLDMATKIASGNTSQDKSNFANVYQRLIIPTNQIQPGIQNIPMQPMGMTQQYSQNQ